MQITADITGFDRLQRRVARLADDARRSKFIRRGISEAVSLVAKAQRNAAPVRRQRLQRRKFSKLMERAGASRQRSLRRASVVNRKFGLLRKSPVGPHQLREIRPGQLKRSIHGRTRLPRVSAGGGLFAKAGINVAQKRYSPGRAPHGHLVALGTVARRTKSGANRGVMPRNPFIRDASAMVAAQARRLLEKRVREDFDRAVREVART